MKKVFGAIFWLMFLAITAEIGKGLARKAMEPSVEEQLKEISNKINKKLPITEQEMNDNYFKIIEEANVQLLSLIDKLSINSSQYFPMFGFDKINPRIKNSAQLKDNQINNIENTLKNIPDLFKKNHNKIEDIFNDDTIANSNKAKAILWETMNDNISLDDIEEYLRKSDLKTTDDKRLLCAYDMKRYK